jgi:hypothetical protein
MSSRYGIGLRWWRQGPALSSRQLCPRHIHGRYVGLQPPLCSPSHRPFDALGCSRRVLASRRGWYKFHRLAVRHSVRG